MVCNRSIQKLFFISVALFYSSSLQSACGGTVLWHNASDTGCGASFNPGISEDVYNQNIDIDGVNALVDGIKVVASTCDITITITTSDAVITGSGNRCDGVLTDSARLYLFAEAGRIINFNLTHDLMFRGTANGSTLLDLLVSFSGGGLIQINLLGDHTVTFSSLATTGGARGYRGMDGGSILVGRQTVAAADTEQNITFGIGPKSLFGYLSTSLVAAGAPTGSGVVVFDVSNTATGRTVLRIDDCSEFLISGRFLNNSFDNEFLINDIILTDPAGSLATLGVFNGSLMGNLIVINKNKCMTSFAVDPFCDQSFILTGTQYGFILGNNGNVNVDNTYIDYVGLSLNRCPTPGIVLSEELTELGLTVQSVIKERNPSAFIVDGFNDPNATPASVFFSGSSAIYFRSGVDEDGAVTEMVDNSFSFTVSPEEINRGAGNLVFDVEGDLNVFGTDNGHQALHILSLQVTPTGGPVLVRSGETTFPLRTFARDSNGDYLRYNSAYAMINSRMNLSFVSLVHDDQNHLVFEKNDVKSEPTYTGGDKFNLIKLGICSGLKTCTALRPKITLNNAIVRVHTDIALTGVDLLTPNNSLIDNTSSLLFYGNGRIVDSGNGRQMILGTDLGSFACDGGTIIDRDAHLDIIQEVPTILDLAHLLTLAVSSNDTTINEFIDPAIPVSTLDTQASVHTIYLGHATNISVGTNDIVGTDSACNATFSLTTTPHLLVDGCFFSIDTHGGTICYPEVSNVTGEGGVFVDTNGLFDVANNRRMNISAMVTKSRNGQVRLSRTQVFFNTRVGISDWRLNLVDPSQRIVIPEGVKLTNYTLDWIATTKDYVTSDSLVPYELCSISDCFCPPVTNENLRALPEIHGTVDQFQIKRSRLGDMAQIKVGKGGFIKELVYLSGYDSAEAPTGIVVLENDGRVGLGSAHKDVDSLQASIFLGANGVTLIPNGNGEVLVNENLIVNNFCHILSGTAFGVTGPQVLSFVSEVGNEIRVKKGGVLDLTSFTNTNQIVDFSGQLSLVLETGATVRMGGGCLRFSGDSTLSIQRNIEDLVVGVPPTVTEDAVRVKFVGAGEVRMIESANMNIHEEASLGIETEPTCLIDTTSLQWTLYDSAQISIGDDTAPGGGWQIGNTTNVNSTSITFSLISYGLNSSITLGQRGFFGLGAGIISKGFLQPVNTWTIGSLFNINNISILIPQGTFNNNEIEDGNGSFASLLAIGGNTEATFGFTFDEIDAQIRGGGNLVKLSPSALSVTPTVLNVAGVISADLTVGIAGSKGHLIDPYSVGPNSLFFLTQPTATNAAGIFEFLHQRTNNNPADRRSAYASPKGALAVNTLTTNSVGYVQGTTIFRPISPRIIGEGGLAVNAGPSLNVGAANLKLNPDGSISSLVAYVV